MADCTCDEAKHDARGEKCERCGGFACAYADKGKARCPQWRCDCFIETHPDSPFDLHPEEFTVLGVQHDSDCECPQCLPGNF